MRLIDVLLQRLLKLGVDSKRAESLRAVNSLSTDRSYRDSTCGTVLVPARPRARAYSGEQLDYYSVMVFTCRRCRQMTFRFEIVIAKRRSLARLGCPPLVMRRIHWSSSETSIGSTMISTWMTADELAILTTIYLQTEFAYLNIILKRAAIWSKCYITMMVIQLFVALRATCC